MRINHERIKALQLLLKDQYGLEYSDEQAQEAGMAIMRFLIAKAQHKSQQHSKEDKNYACK